MKIKFMIWYGIPVLFTLPLICHGFFVQGMIPSKIVCLAVFGSLGWIHVMMLVSLLVSLSYKTTESNEIKE